MAFNVSLYEIFAPALFVSRLISALDLGFPVANAALLALSVSCWAVPVPWGTRAAPGLLWFWTLRELGNGLPFLALARGGYLPSAITAPLLLLFAAWRAALPAG